MLQCYPQRAGSERTARVQLLACTHHTLHYSGFPTTSNRFFNLGFGPRFLVPPTFSFGAYFLFVTCDKNCDRKLEVNTLTVKPLFQIRTESCCLLSKSLMCVNHKSKSGSLQPCQEESHWPTFNCFSVPFHKIGARRFVNCSKTGKNCDVFMPSHKC